jgi:hypothetical protein
MLPFFHLHNYFSTWFNQVPRRPIPSMTAIFVAAAASAFIPRPIRRLIEDLLLAVKHLHGQSLPLARL